jgi:hypothetical protein
MPVISIPQAFNEDEFSVDLRSVHLGQCDPDLIRSRLSGTATHGRRPRRG